MVSLSSVREGRAPAEVLPSAHPRDLVGVRIVVIAARQHDALLGALGVDPDAMTPLSWSRDIAALLKYGFQSADFHTAPVSFLKKNISTYIPERCIKFLPLIPVAVSTCFFFSLFASRGR
jgi:hypothetical protein